MSTHIVLVPGFWLGASAWDAVVAELTARGLSATPLTLPGVDGRGGEVTLADQADAIRAAFEAGPTAERRVLVVHSGGSFPGTLFVDRHPELVDHVVFVDTAPPMSGIAFNPEQTGQFTLQDAWEMLEEEGSFRDLTEDQLADFRETAVPMPESVVTEEITLSRNDGHGVPATVVCTAFSAADYQSYADQGIPFIAAINEWSSTLVDLPTGHWPMWSKPAELAEIIAGVAQDV